MSRRPAYRKPSKSQRRAALHEFLAGLPEPPELPEEAEAITTSASTPGEITIIEDGTTMHGTDWTLPTDFAEAEVLDGALPSLKGTTPPELPGLEDDSE